MERAGRLIQKGKLSRQILSDEEIARAAWPEAVGKAIAAHTFGVRLVRKTLVVEVEDAIWQRQLHRLTAQIVHRMRKITGSEAIDDLEFRIAVPRKQVQRAESMRSVATDYELEAERIEDPVLRKLYRTSRNKASA